MKTTKLTVDDQNDEIRAQVEREMPRPIGGFENTCDEDEHRLRQDARFMELVRAAELSDVVPENLNIKSAAKIMGLKIRPGEPDDLTIAQLIRQRADLLAALEKLLAAMEIQNILFTNQASAEGCSIAARDARTAIQSAKGGK